jgi:hypothetical protein
MSSMTREFGARDSEWRNTTDELAGDGIQVIEGMRDGKQVRGVLIVTNDIASLQNNPAFVTALRSVLEGVGSTIYIDKLSVDNIKLFDQSLFDALTKKSLMNYST